MAYIRQTISVKPETGYTENHLGLAFHTAQLALQGNSGYQICFEPSDIPTLVEYGIIKQTEIDWANKYGEIHVITVNPTDHEGRVTFQAITKGSITGPYAGIALSVTFRNDHPLYGIPLGEDDFLNFIGELTGII